MFESIFYRMHFLLLSLSILLSLLSTYAMITSIFKYLCSSDLEGKNNHSFSGSEIIIIKKIKENPT